MHSRNSSKSTLTRCMRFPCASRETRILQKTRHSKYSSMRGSALPHMIRIGVFLRGSSPSHIMHRSTSCAKRKAYHYRILIVPREATRSSTRPKTPSHSPTNSLHGKNLGKNSVAPSRSSPLQNAKYSHSIMKKGLPSKKYPRCSENRGTPRRANNDAPGKNSAHSSFHHKRSSLPLLCTQNNCSHVYLL